VILYAAAAAAAAADVEVMGRTEFVLIQAAAVAEERSATKWHQLIRKQGAGQAQSHLQGQFAAEGAA
jgi:hypothetical protein